MATTPTLPPAKPRKLLGVRATAEERRIIAEAAAREHRSISSFVLRAAITAAATEPPLKRKHSREEILAIFQSARNEFQLRNPTGRDPVAELIAERRAEAANE